MYVCMYIYIVCVCVCVWNVRRRRDVKETKPVSSCEQRNQSLGAMEGGEFIAQLGDC